MTDAQQAARVRQPLVTGADGVTRCGWVGDDGDYERYHDDEWGSGMREDRDLYEKLCLEGFQAGLSWITILKRRPALRAAFHGFDPARVAAMGEDDVERLMHDAALIRNRAKILAAIGNARAVLALDVPLAELMWSFAPEPDGRPRPRGFEDLPAATPESAALSRELKRRGFRFVGPTTMYALMQAAGMVDDHIAGCWRAG